MASKVTQQVVQQVTKSVLTNVSLQAKITLGISIPIIILSQLSNFSFLNLIQYIIIFILVAFNANCLVVTGNKSMCNSWSWIAILLPIFLLLTNVLYDLFTPKKTHETDDESIEE
jgi:hypothetical protein